MTSLSGYLHQRRSEEQIGTWSTEQVCTAERASHSQQPRSPPICRIIFSFLYSFVIVLCQSYKTERRNGNKSKYKIEAKTKNQSETVHIIHAVEKTIILYKNNSRKFNNNNNNIYIYINSNNHSLTLLLCLGSQH